MGFRFRKSLRLLPGLKINFSKSFPSLTLGGRGLSYNIGSKGTRTTVGVPGSGMSYSTYSPHAKNTDPATDSGAAPNEPVAKKGFSPSVNSALVWIAIIVILAFSAAVLR